MITELIDYRSIPRVSNSDLTRLKEELLGLAPEPITQRFPEQARPVGRASYSHLMEPEKVGNVIAQLLPDMKPAESNRLPQLTQYVQHDSFCNRYLRKSEKERVVLFTDPESGVACKARLDTVYTSPKRQRTLVMDFKTTSARTQGQFLQSCYDYDYDRQAAFYLDSLRYAESKEWDATSHFNFIFIGVSQDRRQLFAVDATALPNFIEYGRKKYRFWLRKWQEQQTANTEYWALQAS